MHRVGDGATKRHNNDMFALKDIRVFNDELVIFIMAKCCSFSVKCSALNCKPFGVQWNSRGHFWGGTFDGDRSVKGSFFSFECEGEVIVFGGESF